MKKFIIIFVFCLLSAGCSNYDELNNLSIVTGVSLDKKDDIYEVSYLIANSPKGQTSSKEGEAKTTVYSGKGKTIPDAAMEIEQKSPKKIYLGHINVVVISEEISKEGFFKTAGWLIRNSETRKKFYLLQAKDEEAKNILKIVSPLESFPSQSIATLLESNHDSKSASTAITYSTFIGHVLEKGYDPILPSISIVGDPKKGSNEENIKTTTPTAYNILGPLAIFRSDKLVGYATIEESQFINLLQNQTDQIKYTLKINNNKISIDSYNISSNTKLKDKNTIDINIKASGTIQNISGNINIKDYNEIKNIENHWNENLKKDLYKIIDKMKNEYECDVFGFGNKIYLKYPRYFEKIEKDWNDKYFKNVKVNIKTDLKIISTGSLQETLKEAKK